MSMLKLALLSAVAVVALPQISVRAENIDVQFVGGSRNAIPANTLGTLNLDDAKELKFNYGTAVYRVPYTQITGADIQKSEDGHKLFGRVPLPSLTPWKRKQVLSVSFKDSADKTGTLNFQLWTKDATWAQLTLAERRDPKASTTQTAGADDSWWGDKYWKTTRNHSNWGSAKPVEASQAPQTAASVSKK